MLKAGFAQIDITPPVGTAMTGYILRNGPAEGVHDPLYASALVLDDGERRVAILACDILGVDRQFLASARAAIEQATAIPCPNVMITCTHTHGGPATIFLQDCGEVDEGWLKTIGERLVEVTGIASSSLRPVQPGMGQGHVTEGVHNRRLLGDAIDPALGVLCFDDTQGGHLAVLFNYTCHPTCLGHDNRLLSADYPGYLVAAVQRETGAIPLFTTGAIGDVGPVSKQGYRSAEALGSALAVEALRVLENGITPLDDPTLKVAAATLDLPLQALPSAAEVREFEAEQRRLLSDAESSSDPGRAKAARAMLAWSATTLAALAEDPETRTVQAEIQVIGIGSVALVGVPGELFVELGLAIKQESGAGPVFVCGFANHNIGYIPTRRAYPLGGYEVQSAYRYYGYPAALAPEAGELVVETAVELIRSVRRSAPNG